mmetsp:Transcript_51228/g.103000  ORF Transcript_51228/g.103000 Transcript_51228/m.103000 type:complete len:271 (-) Transcript_51228:94-906(-)
MPTQSWQHAHGRVPASVPDPTGSSDHADCRRRRPLGDRARRHRHVLPYAWGHVRPALLRAEAVVALWARGVTTQRVQPRRFAYRLAPGGVPQLERQRAAAGVRPDPGRRPLYPRRLGARDPQLGADRRRRVRGAAHPRVGPAVVRGGAGRSHRGILGQEGQAQGGEDDGEGRAVQSDERALLERLVQRACGVGRFQSLSGSSPLGRAEQPAGRAAACIARSRLLGFGAPCRRPRCPQHGQRVKCARRVGQESPCAVGEVGQRVARHAARR